MSIDVSLWFCQTFAFAPVDRRFFHILAILFRRCYYSPIGREGMEDEEDCDKG